MDILGVVLFGVTYVLMSARRLSWLGLDRPAVALAGAVACVLFGVLSPTDALAAVDGSTLLLLLGMMGMGAFLAVDGFFDALEPLLLTLARRSPARLLGAIVWGAGVLGALITNDAVCVLGTPLIVRLVQRHRLPPLPLLLALATGANTGSVATLVGNPQNMLCGLLGDLSYLDYALRMAPVALVSLALNHLLLVFLFRRDWTPSPLSPTPDLPPDTRISAASQRTLLVLLATAVACAAGAPLDWSAAAGFVTLFVLHRDQAPRVWAAIDGSLLVFFAGLFIVVEAFVQTGVPALLFARVPLQALADSLPALAALFLLGSNLVSNVPFILVIEDQMAHLPSPTLGWQLLAMASTFAGNLTLLGSAANIIVAEGGRDIGGMGFWQHLRVGAPLALLTTLLGTLWLMILA